MFKSVQKRLALKRLRRRCCYCGGAIEKYDTYVRVTELDDATGQTVVRYFHDECFDSFSFHDKNLMR